MLSFPIMLTIYAGFMPAFEADHLLAVSNIVSQRNNARASVKDGIYWGLGHSSTILIIGIMILVFRTGFSARQFNYFEALVGIMLILLGFARLNIFFSMKSRNLHVDGIQKKEEKVVAQSIEFKHIHTHSLAYGIGLIHGLAGGGTLILIVMSQVDDAFTGLLYLLVFAAGCILGMMAASAMFCIPFSKRMMDARMLRTFLVMGSAVLCLVYGGKLLYTNLYPH